ncbi:NAD(P)-dependent oxidoreductase [Candidatus Roizmanbacteria bacterium]|nr:MAG: NAD(P)-dependent oxidoreductase [Candidatus Roizmanbacteria bacterium]
MGRKKLTVLLTGSGGYIGKNVLTQLSDSYNFLAPRSKELDLTEDTAVSKFFQEHSIDVVIHGAVVGGSRKEEAQKDALKTNLRIFMNIMRNAGRYSKLVHLGSGAEYDKRLPMVDISEDEFDRSIPNDDYGFYKYLCSKYVTNTPNSVNLRIFGIFGKYEDYRLRFISNAICRNILGLPITINQNVVFDYVYVNDFVKIIDYFIQNDTKEKQYNIATGKKIDLATIAGIINEISGKPSEIIIKNPGMNNEYTANADKLKKELGNFSFTPFKKSVSELYIWYREHMNELTITKEIL